MGPRFPQERRTEQDELLRKKLDKSVSDDEYKQARSEYQQRWKRLDDEDNASQECDD